MLQLSNKLYALGLSIYGVQFGQGFIRQESNLFLLISCFIEAFYARKKHKIEIQLPNNAYRFGCTAVIFGRFNLSSTYKRQPWKMNDISLRQLVMTSIILFNVDANVEANPSPSPTHILDLALE